MRQQQQRHLRGKSGLENHSAAKASSPAWRVEGGGMLRAGADSSFRPEWTVVQSLEEK